MPEIKVMWESWADQAHRLPAYETPGAAGADVRANFPVEQRSAGLRLEPMQRALVPTGFHVEIPRGYEIQVRPRSGLALKHGVTLVNAPGTIDSDYRGPVGVLLVNLGTEPFEIAHGDRIAQLVVAPLEQARFQVTDGLGQTRRGAGGFGSTGVD